MATSKANSFQHVSLIWDNQMKDRGFELVVVGNTITTPMGLYSDKITDPATLEEGATIGIPNDPTNGGRALLVLQQLGLITLDLEAGLKPTILDVTGNPKDLKFKELDAAQLPRSLADLDAAMINTNYAIASGLNPKKPIPSPWKAPTNPYGETSSSCAKGDEDQPWVENSGRSLSL